jgi:tRNA(Ile)-lysidine synthase
MLKRFIDFISKEKLIAKGEKVLLTVSGGRDSMAMCHLFAQSGFPFGIANCNFGLRGEESDGDSRFVEEWAKKNNIPLHLHFCDAAVYAKENGISIQMAARDLRFAWFEELCEKENYSLYATAHHADDAIETYFINQLRGTGIAGLHGLLPKKGKLIHPLLFATRQDIDHYIELRQLPFREDSSNASTKYMRNALRHKVLPILEDIQPAYRAVLMQNMKHFSAVEAIYLRKIEEEQQNICSKKGGRLLFSISKLHTLENASTYLYEFLKAFGFGFAQAEEIFISVQKGQVGAQFYSASHVLLRDRDDLILSEIQMDKKESFKLLNEEGELKNPIHLKWEIAKDKKFSTDSNQAFIDLDKVKFPLTLRKWERGDTFYPLGMPTKKLLSDFFIDQKLNRFEKESTYLLVSGEDIVWVVGKRLDNRFRITEKTARVLKIEWV